MSAFFAAHSVSLTPADSWVEGQAASKAITIPDAAPTNAGGKLYVHPHCTCSGKYPVLPTRVTLGLPISDAQNTPLYIDVASISCGTLLSPATFGTLQGVNLSLDIAGCSGHVQLGVTANDGHPRQPPSQPASYDVTFYCNEDDCGAPAPGAGQ